MFTFEDVLKLNEQPVNVFEDDSAKKSSDCGTLKDDMKKVWGTERAPCYCKTFRSCGFMVATFPYNHIVAEARA